MQLRRTVAFGLAGLALAACSPDAAPVVTDLDAASVRFQALQADLAAVNDAQAVTVGLLRPTLDAYASVDSLVALLFGDDTLDDGLARVPAARIALDLVDLEPVRPALADLARRVDDARIALRRAEDVFGDGADRAHLEATDDVLVALRDLSSAQDALAQVVTRHLPVYEDFLALVEDFRERRSRFRSRAEATDAWSVESRELLRDLGIAQADIAQFLEARDQDAKALAEAQLLADALRDEREATA